MNTKLIRLLPALLLGLVVAPQSHAQDPAKVAPGVYKCTFENERTRLCEITVKPGKKIATHSHPDHLVYITQPGKLRITDTLTGKSNDAEFTKGQSVWIPSATHHAENIGSTELKGLMIEFKDGKGPMDDRK